MELGDTAAVNVQQMQLHDTAAASNVQQMQLHDTAVANVHQIQLGNQTKPRGKTYRVL